MSEPPNGALSASLGLTVARPSPRPLSPWAPFAALSSLALLLLMLSIGQDALMRTGEHRIWLLDVDEEHNVYAWLSSAVLLGAAVSLFDLGDRARMARAPFVAHWFILSLTFGALSADEIIGLHEKLSLLLADRFQTSGALYPAWVVPPLLACAAGALAYIPFLRALPVRIRRLTIASALLYVGGAAGVEMLAGPLIEAEAWNTPLYRALVTLEEGLELTGAILFLYTLTLLRRSGVMERGNESA